MSRATSFASVAQQLSLSAGVAVGALVLEFERMGRPDASVVAGDFPLGLRPGGGDRGKLGADLRAVAQGGRRQPVGRGPARSASRRSLPPPHRPSLVIGAGAAQCACCPACLRGAPVVAVLGHQRGEDAFAQAPVGHAQALAGPDPEQRLEDGAARQHEIGALMPDARLRHALGIGHGDQIVGNGAHVAGAEPASIDPRALVDRKLEMNAGDRGDGARGAEEMGALAGDPVAEAMLLLEALRCSPSRRPPWPRSSAGVTSRPPWRSARLTTPIGNEVQAAMQACTSSRSCSVRRQGRPSRARSSQISSELPPPISNTSVKSQLRSISEAQPDTASLASVSCVTISMDEAGLAPRALDELAAIGGDAAGFGGDQPRARHRAPAHLLGADLERFDGAAHGGFRQPARAQHAFAETDDAGEGVDDEKAAARGLGDEQPAIIGAEIESAINERRRRPRWRACVIVALGCHPEAIGRRVRTRTGCDLRRAATSPAVAGLASHGLGVTRSYGSRAGIAARPIHDA